MCMSCSSPRWVVVRDHWFAALPSYPPLLQHMFFFLPSLPPSLPPYLRLPAGLLKPTTHALISFHTTDQRFGYVSHGLVRVPPNGRPRLFLFGGGSGCYTHGAALVQVSGATSRRHSIQAAASPHTGHGLVEVPGGHDTGTGGGGEGVGRAGEEC